MTFADEDNKNTLPVPQHTPVFIHHFTVHHSPTMPVGRSELFQQDNQNCVHLPTQPGPLSAHRNRKSNCTTSAQPLISYTYLSAKSPRLPIAEMKDAKQQTVMLRCHSMMALSKPVSPWAVDFIPAFREVYSAIDRANPQAG